MSVCGPYNVDQVVGRQEDCTVQVRSPPIPTIGIMSAPCAQRTCRPMATTSALGMISGRDVLAVSFTAPDPGCVKTPQTQDRLEWSFIDQLKSTALKNSRDPNRDPKEASFYGFSAPSRFHTTKTHIGHAAIWELSSIATGSLWLDVGGFDHRSPFLDLALDELPEIFGRSPLRCDQHIA